MGKYSVCQLCIIFFTIFLIMGAQLMNCSVTYDRKSLIINGQRKIILSGSIHYARSTPEMWEDLIMKAKNAGLDAIDTYVFWGAHEPSPGNYYFEERYDLVRFIKTVQKVGLFVQLRIGPYICAEWNFGGFPVWLKYVQGISFRTNNEPFKVAMQSFTKKIVEMMKSENLFASQGGPIILSQIENEFGLHEKDLGAAGVAYVKWAAAMAVGLNTGVPWTMCREEDAPDPVINTCNGMYCDNFSPNKPYKPTMWTEAWTGWFSEFGNPKPHRPVQDLAFAVARFILRGGSFVNYYMFHGGTNFGRTSGSYIATSYDYDAPIDEFGLIRDPKYGHLKELHKAIKLCEQVLVSCDPTTRSLGSSQQAHVFSTGNGGCAAFLSNVDTNSAARVVFNNRHYNLPPWSISILPDCKNVVFNTAEDYSYKSKLEMVPTKFQLHTWETYAEDASSVDDSSSFTVMGLLEQINITKDRSDYLWYITRIDISPSEAFLSGGPQPTLSVNSKGHALQVFVNGQLSGSASGRGEKEGFTFSGPVRLQVGTNIIALLSMVVGLPSNKLHFETWGAGISRPVLLHGLNHGEMDLTWQRWTYKVGCKGETMNLFSPEGASSVEWIPGPKIPKSQQPLTWYKSYFDAPDGNEPVALDLKSMTKGQAWINGQSIGRYWSFIARGSCEVCHYSGTYRTPKCQTGCGKPTQRWYHVPRSWLKQRQNLLVVFEEQGGDASKIALVKRVQS